MGRVLMDDEIVVDLLDDPVGWERLRLIIDVRAARDSGLVRFVDGRVFVRDLPADLYDRMASHRDLLRHALTYDKEQP